ncbi:MAG TPA: riboflavin biosynthesis protein RibF [Candidatus Omnitrophota bacterium]|nr:riboflavin biosynthesis protein RibF [Candidatus Omnitrophota bacterium]HPN56107.1 riboflavin biosynthesis protein RibF [Candidatus Omnitrophota bacterium]
MELITRLSQVKKQYPHPVIAIGVFDGLHRGHQKVIHQVVKKARACHGTAVVMTFYPHPLHVLRPGQSLPLIMTLSLRERLLSDFGLDVCWLIHFTREFSRIPPRQFIEKYLVERMAPHTVIIGDDFRFGRDRLGTLALFREEGERHKFKVQTVPTSKGAQKIISSTMIRQHILDGDLPRASRLLGRPFAIEGNVVHGDALGRQWGFPTANVSARRQLIPPSGVYIVYVQYQGRLFPGMAYIGRKPSIRPSGRITIEVNIFNFNRNIYGEKIIIFFNKKIREEIKFDSRHSLVRQIQSDEANARRWFRRTHLIIPSLI